MGLLFDLIIVYCWPVC